MTMQSQALTQTQTIALCAEFIIYKAKLYSHNTILTKQKAINYLLLHQNPTLLQSFKDIRRFLRELQHNGLCSAHNLDILPRVLEFYCKKYHQKYGGFNPMMSESEFFSFFLPLTKTLKNSTLAQYTKALELFLRYLKEEKALPARSLAGMRQKFRKEKTLPSFLNTAQYHGFLTYVQDMKARTLIQKRDKLTMLLVGYTGMRTREVNNLLLENMTKDNSCYVFKVQGKCFKERYVSVKCGFIQEALEDFLHTKKQMGIATPYITQIKSTNTPSKNHIDLKPILKKLNAIQPRGNYLHLLRHSFGSFVYSKSKDIMLTQQALGHTSLASTQVYIHLNQEAHIKVAGFF